MIRRLFRRSRRCWIQFQETFENIRIKTLLSGEYDTYDAIVTLHAGAGGTESCDWASMLYRMYTRWADKKGFSIEVLDYLDGDEAGIKSVTFQVNGDERLWLSEVRKGCTPSRSDFPVQCGGQASDIFREL